MKTLFDHAREKILKDEQPLAARMRPRTLDEYIGQEHILAPGRLLRRAIQADQLSSLIFYGPPGTGKTTLASVIANTTKSEFVTLNAVLAGIADLRQITEDAQRRLGEQGKRTILFIDEVHRWNKAQQDALLPWVENGTVILIGATTENPYFTVNRALVSRSRIFQLKPLDNQNIQQIILQALNDKYRGFGTRNARIDTDALEHLADVANGDARAALNALELAVETTPPNPDGAIVITMDVAEESIQKRAVLYDKEGDCHFDTISAFIKSMRGSDVDATFYWLAKMVYAGEDPRFILRRMVIFASEDIGMADPHALPFVISCAESFDRIGLPEGHYPLAHAALYCATAPKSNSVMGFFDALKLVGEEREQDVPNHLRDASRDKEGFGHGQGYKYPHAYTDHWVAQQYLPGTLQGKIFYEPGAIGYEATLAATIRLRRELQLAAVQESDNQLAPPEILTFTPPDKRKDAWLARAVDALAPALATIREQLFDMHSWQRHERVLDLTADAGVLTWEALRKTPEGLVTAVVRSQQAETTLAEQAAFLPNLTQPQIIQAPTNEVLKRLLEQSDVKYDVIIGRNAFSFADNRQNLPAIIASALDNNGTVLLADVIPKYAQRLTALLKPSIPQDICQRLADAENALYQNAKDPLVNWDENTLAALLANAGLSVQECHLHVFRKEAVISRQQLSYWFAPQPQSFAQRLATGLTQDDIALFQQAIQKFLLNQKVSWEYTIAFIKATR